MSLSVKGTITTGVAVTGTYTQSSTCIGTLKITPAGFTTQNYSTYAVDENKELLLIEPTAERPPVATCSSADKQKRCPGG